MFYQHFEFYGFLYIIVTLQWLIFRPNKRNWQKFVKIVSLYNSAKTVLVLLLNRSSISQKYPFLQTLDNYSTLNSFAAYLVVDAIFHFSIPAAPVTKDYFALLHNSLWSLVLWVTGENEIGAVLGIYVAANRISDHRFYHVFMLIPFWYYLTQITLTWIYRFSVFGGSLAHTLFVCYHFTEELF